MRIVLPSIFSDSVRSTRRAALPACLFLLTALVALPVAAPQTLASTPAKTHSPVVRKKALARKGKRNLAKPVAQSAPVAVATPAATASLHPLQPPKPDWPVNDKPLPPSIVWNASGLRIEASNSSLQQILKEVSTLTGSAIEGFGADERVYGTYGPGPVREVLPKLLYGSAYNLLLIGDMGQGTPRQILLSPRGGGGKSLAAVPHPAASDDDDVDDVEEEQPQQQPQRQPPQVRNSNFGGQPGGGQDGQRPQGEPPSGQQQQPPE